LEAGAGKGCPSFETSRGDEEDEGDGEEDGDDDEDDDGYSE
jgi:hypothetical protein